MATNSMSGGTTQARPAARVGDEVAHGFGLAGMITGAVAGALIGAAVLAATAATGGLALAIMGGAIAGGGLSVLQVVKGLSTVFDWPEPTTGKLARGSPNVFINGRPAVRAGDDAASSCTGLALNHPLWPFHVTVAEGSATVFINGKPAARVGSKLVCGAHITTGSDNVFIGGATVTVAFVLDIEGWMKTGLEVLGGAAVGAAAVLAAMAGATVLAGVVVAGAVAMGGMALLGDVGDRLGPGYRDLLQGVAGMVLMGMGPKVARSGRSAKVTEPAFKAGFTHADILAIPKGSRPNPDQYLEPWYVTSHLALFEKGASRFTTKATLEKYGIAREDGTTFVMPSREADQMLTAANGDSRKLEKILGLPEGALEDNKLMRIDIAKPKDFNLRVPSGNEAGANEKWLPGGRLPDGNSEAVLDAGKLGADSYQANPLTF